MKTAAHEDYGWRLGVDVGGTNTDCVIMAGKARVLASAKATTTPDVLTGMTNAIRAAAANCENSGVLERVQAVMVGVTTFINALITRSHLARVLVVRLCGPATRALPPFVDIPEPLHGAICAGYVFVQGGYEYDGTEISTLNDEDIQAVAARVLSEGITSVVVCGVFAPLNNTHEELFADKLRTALAARPPGMKEGHENELPASQQRNLGPHHVHITLSHRLGQLGLLERENAAILNGALMPLAARVVPQYRRALAAMGLEHAALFLTANDGTLLAADVAQELPIATLQSGPVNSVRGAAFLSGLQNAVVLDIGGTTTDAGVVQHGLPRPASRTVSICGVRTNFRMPDVLSIGLGGGSYVCCSSTSDDAGDELPQCTVGPQSVGNDLIHRALVLRGDTVTATDVAVLLGRMDLGTLAAIKQQPPKHDLEAAWNQIQTMLAQLVDNMKTSREDVPVVVVGGGAKLCGDQLAGAQCVVRPEHADVANAVGAAIPQVSGSVDAVFALGAAGEHRGRVLQQATERATSAAIAAGAVPSSCSVVEQDVVPLAYLPGGAARVRVRVVGDVEWEALVASRAGAAQQSAAGVQDLSCKVFGQEGGIGPPGMAAAAAHGLEGDQQKDQQEEQQQQQEQQQEEQQHEEQQQEGQQQAAVTAPTLAVVKAGVQPGQALSAQELAAYLPHINNQGEWQLSELDIEAMALGAAVLGTGGGGSAHNARLRLLQQLRAGRTARVLAPEMLADDAVLVDCGGMGAPTVSAEKLDANETQAAVQSLAEDLLPRRLGALLCAEAGGGNCLEPLVVGAAMGLPVLDADLMGRAFPELQMSTSAIAGVSLTPAALADEKGNAVVVRHAADAKWVERLMRAVCTEMGCTAGLATSPMDGATAKRVCVLRSLSLAWHLGMAIMQAHANKEDPVAAVIQRYGGGKLLFVGKVVDVVRVTSAGFVRGSVVIEESAGLPQQGVPQCTSAPMTGTQEPRQDAPTIASGNGSGDSSSSSGLVRQLVIDFQNENLVARLLHVAAGQQRQQQVLACVPDLICCLETATAVAVPTEDLRYGLRLSVVALPAHPLLRTPEALAVVGPAAFGYADVEYCPVADFMTPTAVHTLFTHSSTYAVQ